MSKLSIEEEIAYDRRPAIMKGALAIGAIAVFSLFVAYLIASGFASA